jgi:GAF domain-containing protein
LRLRGRVLGALNLFHDRAGPLDPADVGAAQALADVAAIAILQSRATSHAQILTEQLQTALDSRVVIEQAKGMLAERAGVGLDDAFTCLRRYARGSQRLLAEVAGDVVAGQLGANVIFGDRPTSRSTAADGGGATG